MVILTRASLRICKFRASDAVQVQSQYDEYIATFAGNVQGAYFTGVSRFCQQRCSV